MAHMTTGSPYELFADAVKTGIEAVNETGVETFMNNGLILVPDLMKVPVESFLGNTWEGSIKTGNSGVRVTKAMTDTEVLPYAKPLTRQTIALGLHSIAGAYVLGRFEQIIHEKSQDPKKAAAAFIKDVVEEAIRSYFYSMEYFHLIGALPGTTEQIFTDISDLHGYTCFNGLVDGGGTAKVNYGLIEFDSEATQTTNGHKTMDLARSDAYGWYSRYLAVGAGGLDDTNPLENGRYIIPKMVRNIRKVISGGKNVRLIADPETFALAEAQMNMRVVPQVNGVAVSEGMESWTSKIMYAPGCVLETSEILDRNAATFSGSDAEDGLIYAYATDRLFRIQEGKPFGVIRDLVEIDGLSTNKAMQFGYTGNFGCKDLRTLGVIVGTAL